jgi:hypothetical protein
MRHYYPKGSEHERIWEDIQVRYFLEDEAEVDPLYSAGWTALLAGDLERRKDIERLIREKRMELCQRRWRREEILSWLYLDSELRKEGKSYAGVHEELQAVACRVELVEF